VDERKNRQLIREEEDEKTEARKIMDRSSRCVGDPDLVRSVLSIRI
jgi:hypothetical protein